MYPITFQCSPNGVPIEVECAQAGLIIRFIGRSETIPLDPRTADLDAATEPVLLDIIRIVTGIRGHLHHSALQALNLLAGKSKYTSVEQTALWAISEYGGGEFSGTVMGGRPGVFRVIATDHLLAAESRHSQSDNDSDSDDGSGIVIGAVRDVRAVRPLVEILRGKRPGRIAVAVTALGFLRDARAVPDLIKVLHTAPDRRKPRTAWALGEICDPRAIPVLSHAMRQGNLELRTEATEAMAKIAEAYQESACFEPLVGRLSDLPQVRLAAAWGLKSLKDPRAFEPLHDVLFLPDLDQPNQPLAPWDWGLPESARHAIAAALVELDDERAADDFLRILELEIPDDDTWVPVPKAEALLGLARLRDLRLVEHWNRYISTAFRVDQALAAEIEDVLREMGACHLADGWRLG